MVRIYFIVIHFITLSSCRQERKWTIFKLWLSLHTSRARRSRFGAWRLHWELATIPIPFVILTHRGGGKKPRQCQYRPPTPAAIFHPSLSRSRPSPSTRTNLVWGRGHHSPEVIFHISWPLADVRASIWSPSLSSLAVLMPRSESQLIPIALGQFLVTSCWSDLPYCLF